MHTVGTKMKRCLMLLMMLLLLIIRRRERKRGVRLQGVMMGPMQVRGISEAVSGMMFALLCH
jgi:hypothetical protein